MKQHDVYFSRTKLGIRGMPEVIEKVEALEVITSAIGEARFGAYVLYEVDEEFSMEIDTKLAEVLAFIRQKTKKFKTANLRRKTG